MAAAVWSGVLSFGLVTLPIDMVAAVESHTIRFRQIQRGTSDRVRNQRVNERTGREVPLEDVVKGYETDDGRLLTIEPHELDEIAPGRSKALAITGFVDLDQVDPVYFHAAYYLAPHSEEYARIYTLLLEAMTESNKAGVGTMVMRGREYLVAVKPERGVLALHTLRWADEVRDPRREVPHLPEGGQAEAEEVAAALQLVDALSDEWNPGDYHDAYRDQVAELLQAKRTGAPVHKAAPPPAQTDTSVVGLMEALEASIARTEKAAAPTPAKTTAAAKKAGKKRTAKKAPAKPQRRTD